MIIACGEALIDMVPQSTGGKEVFYPVTGGSPYNTAIAAARAGADVQFIGRLSKDFFGEALIRRFRDNRVGTDMIIRSDENSTLAFVKLEKGKEPEYLFYTEGTADRSFSIPDLPASFPADSRCLAFGSISMTMEPIATAVETLVLRAREAGNIVVSFDPNIRPFMIHDREAYIKRFEKWAAASDIVKISAVDFEFICPETDLRGALKKVLALGPRLVISTLGAEGAMALLRSGGGGLVEARAPVVNLPVADTIGAGDTFHGAFLSRLEAQNKMSPEKIAALDAEELRETLFFANKAASIVCSRRGADPPTLEEIEKL
ncbi:MAG: carbohydrate kinase [Treponema sp.]|jgi:fructokinase|nr:carbohydrate kinase [Treponema sp.]